MISGYTSAGRAGRGDHVSRGSAGVGPGLEQRSQNEPDVFALADFTLIRLFAIRILLDRHEAGHVLEVRFQVGVPQGNVGSGNGLSGVVGRGLHSLGEELALVSFQSAHDLAEKAARGEKCSHRCGQNRSRKQR